MVTRYHKRNFKLKDPIWTSTSSDRKLKYYSKGFNMYNDILNKSFVDYQDVLVLDGILHILQNQDIAGNFQLEKIIFNVFIALSEKFKFISKLGVIQGSKKQAAPFVECITTSYHHSKCQYIGWKHVAMQRKDAIWIIGGEEETPLTIPRENYPAFHPGIYRKLTGINKKRYTFLECYGY
jgi:hypothetical protein